MNQKSRLLLYDIVSERMKPDWRMTKVNYELIMVGGWDCKIDILTNLNYIWLMFFIKQNLKILMSCQDLITNKLYLEEQAFKLYFNRFRYAIMITQLINIRYKLSCLLTCTNFIGNFFFKFLKICRSKTKKIWWKWFYRTWTSWQT